LDSDRLDYTIEHSDKSIINFPNALYAFVLNADNENGGEIMYIGKTTRSLKNRFLGYTNPGNNQQTNKKVNAGIKALLEKGEEVNIFCFKSLENLSWGQHTINLAAGLEDSLVRNFKPSWNGSQTTKQFVTESQELEREIDSNPNPDNSVEMDQIEIIDRFDVTLGVAYYKHGFINPGVRVDNFFGKVGETVKLLIDGKELEAKIDRTANLGGNVRLYFGKHLFEILQRKFKFGDTISYGIMSDNKIVLLS
jgi:hypothetical protein